MSKADPLKIRLLSLPTDLPDRTIEHAPPWVHIAGAPGDRLPLQGWKLHLSATPRNAVEVLEQALPVLRAHRCAFKVAADSACLLRLNEGSGSGRAQIGKFITVYPDSDEQAVVLAGQLHAATAGLEGPAVPSDRQYCSGSLVYRRYGGFSRRVVLTPNGQIHPAIAAPDGRLVPDERQPWFAPPAWAADPFCAPAADEETEVEGPLGTRYHVLEALHQTGKGGVYLAEDTAGAAPRQVVIKEARHHVIADEGGRDVRDRLRHEFHMLTSLYPLGGIPHPFELFEQEGNLYLVMEVLAGETLRKRLADLGLRGESLPWPALLQLGEQLVEIVTQFHARGVVLRDLTPNNLALEPGGRLRLLDLELAHQLGSELPAFPGRTEGFAPPAGGAGRKTSPADDFYAVGSCLFAMACNCSPLLPVPPADLEERLEHLLQSLRPDLPASFAALIRRLRTQPESVPDLRAALQELSPVASPPGGNLRGRGEFSPAGGCRPEGAPLGELYPVDPGSCLQRAIRIGDWLLEQRSTVQSDVRSGGEVPIAVQSGACGVGLFLSDLFAETGEQRFLEGAVAMAKWSQAWAEAHPALVPPGLYFGLGGLVWLQCRLADATGDPGYLEQGVLVAAQVDQIATAHPDLTHGVAGIGLMHLLLAARTSDPHHLSQARALADRLLAVQGEDGLWLSPLTSPPSPQYGMAHGPAGIGLFLAELGVAAAESRYRDAARRIGRLLIAARQITAGGEGWTWPHSPATGNAWPHWCNGATGVGLFLLRLHQLTGEPEWLEPAHRAAVAAHRCCRTGGVSLCHGMAGEADFLLAMHAATGDPALLADARDLARLIVMQGDEWAPGRTVSTGEAFSPWYMTGQAGVGALFLRLGSEPGRLGPATLPLISRMGAVP